MNDLVMVSDAMEIDSEELKQAKNRAIEAIEHLKSVTQATVTKIEQKNMI